MVKCVWHRWQRRNFTNNFFLYLFVLLIIHLAIDLVWVWLQVCPSAAFCEQIFSYLHESGFDFPTLCYKLHLCLQYHANAWGLVRKGRNLSATFYPGRLYLFHYSSSTPSHLSLCSFSTFTDRRAAWNKLISHLLESVFHSTFLIF